jgi:hypothetical protein
MEKNWIYIGLFLVEDSKKFLKKKFSIPEGWKVFCDHVTLVYNDGSELSKVAFKVNCSKIQSLSTITVTGIGISEKAIALRVAYPLGLVCTNRIPHITIAAKNAPVDSNDIVLWTDVEHFTLYGRVTKK